jgi:hypothetical protein
MFRSKRKAKLLATVLSSIFLLATLLISNHVHVNSKNQQNEINCPLCQLARGTVKFLIHHKVPKIEPNIVFVRLEDSDRFVLPQQIVLPFSVRGPPLA